MGNLENKLRDILVEKGPKREEENTKYSLDENSRHFSYTHYSRNMCNWEVRDRKWSVISKGAKKVFSLWCKLFNSDKCKSALRHEGFCDWKHINARPKHAASVDHITNINSWNELSTGLRKHETNWQRVTTAWQHYALRKTCLMKLILIISLAIFHLIIWGDFLKEYVIHYLICT